MAASFSQSVSTFVIPSVERTDPESVRGSLAQAHVEFERGAVREALRLLRKAAESSDEAGDDLRAVALARAAADLATEVGPTAVPPPPPPPPQPLPPPTSLAPAVVTHAPAPPIAPAPSSAVPAPVLPAPAPVLPAPAPVALAPSPAATAPALAATPPAPIARELSEASLEQLLDAGLAVKVVVKRSARDEGLYVVRRADGHAPALGSREAVLLLIEPDDAFFTPPKR
jgi:hypothetical protein